MDRPHGYSRHYELVAIVAFVGVAVVLLLLLGRVEKGTVTGKVTFRGQPLPGGLIVLVDREGNHHRGPIQPDGTYSVSSVPHGLAKVAVVTSLQRPEYVREPVSGPYVVLPKHYSQPERSGLSLSVRAGPQNMDIDLIDLKEDSSDNSEMTQP